MEKQRNNTERIPTKIRTNKHKNNIKKLTQTRLFHKKKKRKQTRLVAKKMIIDEITKSLISGLGTGVGVALGTWFFNYYVKPYYEKINQK